MLSGFVSYLRDAATKASVPTTEPHLNTNPLTKDGIADHLILESLITKYTYMWPQSAQYLQQPSISPRQTQPTHFKAD